MSRSKSLWFLIKALWCSLQKLLELYVILLFTAYLLLLFFSLPLLYFEFTCMTLGQEKKNKREVDNCGISLLIGTCVSRGVCFEFSMWLPYHGWRAHNWTSGDRGSEFYTNWWLSLTCRITCTDAYFSIAPCKGIRIPKSGNVLLVGSGILGFGIRNTAQWIWNPTENWNPESNFNFQRLESSIWNPESTVWNAESKAVLDCLTLVNLAVMLSNMSFITWFVTCVRQSVVLDFLLLDWYHVFLFFLFLQFLNLFIWLILFIYRSR